MDSIGGQGFERLKNDENWGGGNPFLIPPHLHTFRDKSFTSSRPCQIVMYPAKLQVTFFILVPFPCIHLLHNVQHTALDTALFADIPQGSILLSAIAFSVLVPLTIILVVPIFTFNPLPSIALLHFWNLALKSSKFSLIRVQKCHSIIMILLLHALSQHQPQ